MSFNLIYHLNSDDQRQTYIVYVSFFCTYASHRGTIHLFFADNQNHFFLLLCGCFNT